MHNQEETLAQVEVALFGILLLQVVAVPEIMEIHLVAVD
jgi:hypothetical protein